MTFTGDTVFVVNPQHLANELDGEIVILSFASGEYFGLDEVGTLIWKQLQQRVTLAEICAAVMAEYDVDEAQCTEDVTLLLEEMIAKQLVTVEPA
jgi:hypothetical protein